MVSAGLSAPTASGAGIAASTLSPAASYEIGQYFKSKDAEGSAAHILAHTILGAAVAATGGNNALSVGIAAGGAEAAVPLLAEYLYGKKAKDLTASEKSTISSIVGLAGSAVGATTGDVSSTVQGGQSAQNAVENNKTSYKQDIKHAVLCWSAKCQQEYKDMDARQEAAYRKGQDQALSKFVEDIKNLPNVPKELYDALKNDPQGTAKAILLGLKEIPGNIWDTSVTITKENIAGNSSADFEKLGQAETSAVLNSLSGLLSGGAVSVAKKGGKIVLGLKADFDPNLNVQVNGITSKSTGNIVELKAGSKGDWNKLANKPEANTTYKFENGYTYKTDANGRVSSVQADLKLEANDRNGYQQKVSGRTDRKPDDHGGHLIASMFKGPGEGINIVPMDKAFNGSGGEWYKLETDWKKALEGNKSVKVNIQPVYSGNSKRPDSFIITQSVDSGKPRTLTLKNTATGK